MKITLALLILGLALGVNSTTTTPEVTTTEEVTTTGGGGGGATDGGATDGMTTSGGGNETAATTAAAKVAKAAVHKATFGLSEPWDVALAVISSNEAIALAARVKAAVVAQLGSNSLYEDSEVKSFKEITARRMRRAVGDTEAEVEITYTEPVSQADAQADMNAVAANSPLVDGVTVAEVSGARLLVASALALILPVIARAL